jgi:hypothetical protein
MISPAVFALAEKHGFAAENSCCTVRNPAARREGWENKCSMCGSGSGSAAARGGLPC